LAVRYGQRMTSPEPKPSARIIKLGPISFLRGRGGGNFL